MHYIYNYISVFYKNATENILKCVFKHFLLHLENWESWAYLFFHYSFSKTKGSDLKVSSEFQRLNTTSSNNSTIFKPPSVGPLLLFLCKNIPIGAVYEDIRSWRQSCGVFRWGKGTQLLASVFSQWWNFGTSQRPCHSSCQDQFSCPISTGPEKLALPCDQFLVWELGTLHFFSLCIFW